MIKIRLSKIQLFLFLFIVQTGVVFITVQSAIIQFGGRDAWLIFIGASLVLYLQLIFYEKNYQYFKIGKFVSWLYELYWLVVNILIIQTVTFVLDVFAFPRTPHIVIIFLMVIVSFYANVSRPETVLNLSVILIPMIGVFVSFLLLAYKDLVWSNIFPIGTSSLKQWGMGLLYSQLIFSGAEIYLFLRRYIHKPERSLMKPLFWYWLIFTLFMTFSIVLTLLFFSPAGIEMVPQSILYILKAQQVTFAERLDLVFIYIWLIWSMISFALYSFMKLFLHAQHHRHNKRIVTVVCHIILLFAPLYFVKQEYINMPRYIMIPSYILLAIIIPIFVVLFRRMRRTKQNEG